MFTIVMNQDKQCEVAVGQIAAGLSERKVAHQIVSRFPFEQEDRQAIKDADFLVVVGGDGTVLSALAQLGNLQTPVVPVNFGTLSFITSVAPEDVLGLYDGFTSGQTGAYALDERPVLRVEARGHSIWAFNEAAFKAREMGRLITIRTKLNGHTLPDFRGDGLLIATSTGSTAYNLAAGGPILHPAIEALIYNPICPHALTVKPIVVPGHHEIVVGCRPRNPGEGTVLLVDGNLRLVLEDDEPVTCRLAREKMRFLKPAEENYYDILRAKMKWGV